MISQFVSPYRHLLLGDLNYSFPEGTHAVGRLDGPSEGLLILTTNKSLTNQLLHPSRAHRRVYLVLVAGRATDQHVNNLSDGPSILLKKKGSYKTNRCLVSKVETHDAETVLLPEHAAPWETWLRFELTEGKNRQIRKMCKTENLRCKRLLRISIGNLEISEMTPGQVIEMEEQVIFEKLGLA